MNPFRHAADDGVNRTEIACTKIREDAETKRKTLEEKEKTRRKITEEREKTTRDRIGADGYNFIRFFFICFMAASVTGGFLTLNSYVHRNDPPAFACVDETFVINSMSSSRSCSPGATGQIVGDKLVCTCRVAVPAAVPSTSASAH